MIRAELLKLRLQRTPQVLLGLAVAAVVVTIGVTAGKDLRPVDYVARAGDGTFLIVPILAGILGGFVMGTEYRQDTLKRLAAVGPRRWRILVAKVAVLLGAIVVVSLAVYGVAVGAMAVLASSSGVSFSGPVASPPPTSDRRRFPVELVSFEAAPRTFSHQFGRHSRTVAFCDQFRRCRPEARPGADGPPGRLAPDWP